MKIFSKFIVFFFLPIIIVMVTMELLVRFIPKDYCCKRNFLEANSNQLEVLFLGNSHNYYGMRPSYSKFKSYNAAYVSQTIDYDYYILEKFFKNNHSLKTVVLPMDYFTLFIKLSGSIENWRLRNYYIYYGIHQDLSLQYAFEILNSELAGTLSRVKSFYVDGITEVTTDSLGWGINSNSSNGKDLVKTGLSASKLHTQPVKENVHFKSIEEFIGKTILFCKERNIKLLFVTSPAYHTYTNNLDTLQLNTTIRFMTDIVSQNDNVYYYNLLKSTAFNSEDYYDADHLNEKGAIKFTKVIDSLIDIH